MEEIKKVIPAYWHRSINFGDKLTPYIIQKLTGEEVVYCDHVNDCKRLMVTGSILGGGNLENSVIWGNGFCFYDEPVYKPYEILAVRGPFTRGKFMGKGIDCPEVYGDPGLLLSKLFMPKKGTYYPYGITPHVVDYDAVKFAYADRDYIKVIDLRNSIEDVATDIFNCGHIYSSSLHGIIAAHSYGRNASWVKFSNKVIGDDFKFRDYFHSIHGLGGGYIKSKEMINSEQLFDAETIEPGADLSDQLLKSFPLKQII